MLRNREAAIGRRRGGTVVARVMGPERDGYSRRERMTVGALMTAAPVVCAPATSVAAAAALMLEADSGFLPVVEAGRLCGVVTDRDLFIALATRDRRASHMTVGEVARAEVYSCSTSDDIEDAVVLMRDRRVRRLPVTAGDGSVEGVLSLNDVILARAGSGVSKHLLLDTLQTICAHTHQQLEGGTA
jgi:CBS domain-containing protein